MRAGRFGAYVNWGKVNATIPKSISPDEITLGEAVALIAEREGRPARRERPQDRQTQDRQAAGKAPAKKAGAAKAAAPSAPEAKTSQDQAGRRQGQDRAREDEAKGLNADPRKTIGELARRGHLA